MKTLSLILIIISLASFTRAVERPAEVYALRYVAALDMFNLLKEVDPEYATAIVSVSQRTNTIALDPGFPRLDEIRKILTEIDQKPKQVIYRGVLARTISTPRGDEEVILGRPVCYTLRGKPASFRFSLADGSQFRFEIHVEDIPEDTP